MKYIFVILGLMVMLTACAVDTPDTDPIEDTEPSAIFGTWQLVSAQTPQGHNGTATLTLEDDSMGGQSPCNAYGGSVEYGDGTIRFSDIFQTLMYCEDTHEQETAYFSALNSVNSFALENGHLVLSGDGVELRFERVAVTEQRYFIEPPCEQNPEWYPESSQDMDRLRARLDSLGVDGSVSYVPRGATCRACIDECAESYLVAIVSQADAVTLDSRGWISQHPFPDEGMTN